MAITWSASGIFRGHRSLDIDRPRERRVRRNRLRPVSRDQLGRIDVGGRHDFGIPAAVGWRTLTFGGGKFVAVGQQGTAAGRVMTSADGIAWTTGTIASLDATWHGVTYGGGMYVAVGSRRLAMPH